MIEATEGTTTFARRWRAVYDVVLGVTLFVSLLLPATRQASSGTLTGLRNGMLLLLLDVVVLVMLSRYITSPARAARRQLSTTPAAAQEAPGLDVTENSITVHQLGSASPASLAWSDCAAVVHSRLTLGNGTRFSYLQFVAVHEGRIRRGQQDQKGRALARLLGVTETAASMIWVVPPQLEWRPPLVLAHVEEHHPHVRVVRPDAIDPAE